MSSDPVRERILQQRRPTSTAFSDFPAFNKIGTRDLLLDARAKLVESTKAAGWELNELNPVKTKQLGAVEFLRFYLSGPSRSWILPLCAKDYLITREGRRWWSVSERVINAAMQYEDSVVLTYVGQHREIYATLAGSSKPDDVGGAYLRFNERYFGWHFEEGLRLESWIRDPDRLNMQTRIFP